MFTFRSNKRKQMLNLHKIRTQHKKETKKKAKIKTSGGRHKSTRIKFKYKEKYFNYLI
jgi:hypothetical protein